MKKILIVCLLITVPTLSSKEAINVNSLQYLPELIVSPVDYEQVILTNLWNLGVSIDFSYIILAQFKHESFNFTSNVFIEGNNMSGMKHPSIRKTLSIGTHRRHAKYHSIEDCIIDYVYYLEARKLPQHEVSIEKYIKLLKNKGYFEDDYDNYYKGVKYFYGRN